MKLTCVLWVVTIRTTLGVQRAAVPVLPTGASALERKAVDESENQSFEEQNRAMQLQQSYQ